MFDVGGQRGERRKWIQVFDGITAVLFLAASSEFDMKIREDNATNRLTESLALFSEVWSSRFLLGTGFILFLNKQDVLRDKIESGSRLEAYFPEYAQYDMASDDEGPEDNQEYYRARAFIRDKFLAITTKRNDSRKQSSVDYYATVDTRPRECFCHFTTATDTTNIKKVFDDIHTMIIMSNLLKITPS